MISARSTPHRTMTKKQNKNYYDDKKTPQNISRPRYTIPAHADSGACLFRGRRTSGTYALICSTSVNRTDVACPTERFTPAHSRLRQSRTELPNSITATATVDTMPNMLFGPRARWSEGRVERGREWVVKNGGFPRGPTHS